MLLGFRIQHSQLNPQSTKYHFQIKFRKSEVVALKGIRSVKCGDFKRRTKLIFSSVSDEKEEVFICQKGSDGKWSNPTKEETLSQNSDYNYIEYYGNDFILKGGIGYNKGTQESGYEFLKLQKRNIINHKEL